MSQVSLKALIVFLILIINTTSCKNEEAAIPKEVMPSQQDAFDASDPIALEKFYLLVKNLPAARVETDSKTLADNYNLIGINKDLSNLYTDALMYHNKALSLRLTLPDKAAQAKSYNNLAVVYKEQRNFTKAEYYYTLSLNMFKSLGLKEWEAHLNRNLGLALEAQKKYSAAKVKYTAALTIWQNLKNLTQTQKLYNDINAIRLLDPNARISGATPPRGGEIRGL